MIPFKYPWHVFSCWTTAHTAPSASAFPLNSLLLPSSSQNSHYTPDPVLTARAPCCKGNEGFILLNIMKQWEPLDGMCRLWAGAEGSNWLFFHSIFALDLLLYKTMFAVRKAASEGWISPALQRPLILIPLLLFGAHAKVTGVYLEEAGKQMLISYCNNSAAVICQHLHWTEALFAKVWLWQGC